MKKMSMSYTFSGTDTYSVADVKAVMQSTYEDIIGFANRKMAEYGQTEKWIEDLTYLLKKRALKAFELQLYNANGSFKSYRYDVNAWGVLSSGEKSGGINYFEFPSDTKVKLYAELNAESTAYNEVYTELVDNRGWGTSGSAMNGSSTYERSYVSNDLQLKRSVITK